MKKFYESLSSVCLEETYAKTSQAFNQSKLTLEQLINETGLSYNQIVNRLEIEHQQQQQYPQQTIITPNQTDAHSENINLINQILYKTFYQEDKNNNDNSNRTKTAPPSSLVNSNFDMTTLKDISNKQIDMLMMPPPPPAPPQLPSQPMLPSPSSSLVEEFNENNFVNHLLKHNEPLVSLVILDSLLESSDILLNGQQEPPAPILKQSVGCVEEKVSATEKPKRRKSTPVMSSLSRATDVQQAATFKSKPVKRSASSASFDKENMPRKKIKLDSKETIREEKEDENESRLECLECKKKLSSTRHLDRHIRTVHNKTVKKLDAPTPTNKPLNRNNLDYLSLADNIKSYPCQICTKNFSRENTLLAHFKSFHLNK